jgi:AraC family transcriptional regulator
MTEKNVLEAMSLTSAMGVDDPQRSGTPSFLNRPLRSTAWVSSRVGQLLRRAMKLFETDRDTAWRCLSHASTLLDAASEEGDLGRPVTQATFRRGGLANWQTKTAVAYIEANLASKLEISDLAKAVSLSRSHFSRAFKRSLAMSPMAYLVLRRVEHAKTMMASTTDPLSEIAVACGFADQPHLNRRFRRVVGVSPGVWRRTNAEAPKPDAQTPATTREC